MHKRTTASTGTKAAVTIRDVARMAGVSVATVSRVLNGSPSVREETDREVRRVADRLKYRPNASARSLITNRSHTIGVLLPDMHGEFYSEVIRGADAIARQTGYHLLVSSSHASSTELIAALHSMHGRVDGLLVMAPEHGVSALARECSQSAPTVLLNPDGASRDCSSVTIANFDGARQATHHLLSLGHERVAIVTGPEGNTDAEARLDGYRAALRAAGKRSTPATVVKGDFTEPSGYEAGKALIRLKPRPSAVFVANDRMAVGVIRALNDAGVTLPDDMAIVGFDDIEMSRYVRPALTTIHTESFLLGERAAEQLVGIMTGVRGHKPRHEVLEARVIVRESCGAPRGKRKRVRVRGSGADRPRRSSRH